MHQLTNKCDVDDEAQRNLRQPLLLLLHAIDGGLGHLSRLIAITEELRLLSTLPLVPLFLCETDSRLLEAYGYRFIPIPDRDKAVRYGWPYDIPSLTALSVGAIEAIVDSWRPAIIIHDTHLWEPLVRLGSGVGAKQVAIVRRTPNFKGFLRSNKSTLEEMDLVLFPDDGSSDNRNVEKILQCPTEHVGEIRRPSLSQDVAQDRLPPSGIRILVTSGGGGLPTTGTFLEDASSAIAALHLKDLQVTFVPGPLFGGHICYSGTATVVVLPFVSDMVMLAGKHDVVVCQGGYNTIAELRHVGCCVVCVPQPLDSDDQFQRAAEIAATNHKFQIAHSRDEISECVRGFLNQRHFGSLAGGSAQSESRGASRAAIRILGLVGAAPREAAQADAG